MTTTLPIPTSHATDLPKGAHVFYGNSLVKIFGRERDLKTGIIQTYWVVFKEGTKSEKRYQVAANKLEMKHIITTSQAAVLSEVLRKIEAAQQKSPAMMAALDIDRHDLQKCQQLLSGLEKTNGK